MRPTRVPIPAAGRSVDDRPASEVVPQVRYPYVTGPSSRLVGLVAGPA